MTTALIGYARVSIALTCIAVGLIHVPRLCAQSSEQVNLEQLDDRIKVTISDEVFTEYIFEGYEKPILFPVIGPYGTRMTRDYPMLQDTPHEQPDHVHHKSIWFGHMKVNGESFWHSGDTAGTTVQSSIKIDGKNVLTENKLVDRNGDLVATDSRVIGFGYDDNARYIDYQVTYHANIGDITFGDNKDGQMGIRMNPRLRIKGEVANGKAINANGVTEKKIWGTRAPWIDYWGEVDGNVVGIAIFDHPTNLRHPTWWHARDYGLLSANPFGIHYFESRDDPKAGNYTLKKGDNLTFRHRFVFHKGDYEAAQVADLYQKWITN